MKIWNSMAGWRRASVRAEWLAIGLCTLFHLAEAAPRDAGPVADLDFLEFLGSWETGDGKWVDPSHLDEMPVFETHEKGEKAVDRPLTSDPKQNRPQQEKAPARETETEPKRRGND